MMIATIGCSAWYSDKPIRGSYALTGGGRYYKGDINTLPKPVRFG